jgi:hypothetical protein
VKLLLSAIAIVAALTAEGCGPSCQPTDRVVEEGIRDLEGPVRTFQTSPPEGPFLPFEGGTMLRIRHGLGIQPENVHVTLSFTERPLEAYKGGSSQAAGNQAIVLRQDGDEVAVKNDSCANYFVRVVIVGFTPDDAGVLTDTSVADTSVADAVTDATVDGG